MARIYNLKRGDSFPEEVIKIAEREGISTAVLNAIGGVEKLKLAYYNMKEKRYEEHEYSEFMEVAGIVGNITQKEGKPFLHAHGTFGRRDMSVIGGHVMAATVCPILEVIITPTDNRALRHFDEEFGLNIIYRTE